MEVEKLSTTDQFYKLVDETLKQSAHTLVVKGKEYQRDDNPYHVYDRLKPMMPNQSREEIIWGMAAKHFASVMNIIEDCKVGNRPSEEMLDEKFGDLINYLVIIKLSIKQGI